jgi:small subunit ribosomal protein S16
MVKIRLARRGSKKQPSYRIVVIDSRAARDGKEIEVVGHYNPRTRPSTEVLNEERVLYWLSVGAQPTESMASILKRTGTLARFERLRAGESLETLAAEAKASAAPVPEARTRYPSPAAGQSWVKAREAAKKAG